MCIRDSQNAMEEINYDYVKKNGVRVVRRITGGAVSYTHLEHKLLYGGSRKEKDAIKIAGEVPEEDYTIEFGKAVIRREGKDITDVYKRQVL